MTNFRPAVYQIAPDGTKPGPLTVRRYYCAALIEGNNYPALYTLTRHFATYAAAELRLPECRSEWPNAAVTSLLITFDPSDPAQLEAMARLDAEGAEECREIHQ